MHAFFEVAAHGLHDHDGIFGKFVGDEIVGIFVPAVAALIMCLARSRRASR